MLGSYVIAESGGTKTDWVLIVDGVVKEQRTTGSLHPSGLDSEQFQRFETDWLPLGNWTNLPLYFFGAGCYRELGKDKLSNLLKTVFDSHKVFSDLDAAALSIYGSDEGWFAILGTGSVLGYWNGKKITKVIGGLGYERGDEGGGYFFGKLILSAYRSGKLNDVQKEKLCNVYPEPFPDFDDISTVNRASVSTLAKELGMDIDFNEFHEENFSLFFEKYVVPNQEIKFLGVVGSYGFYNRIILERVASNFEVNISPLIDRPISYLVEQSVCFVE